MTSHQEALEAAQRFAGDAFSNMTATQRQELVQSYCCAACTQASVKTGQPGTNPFNGPFVGTPIGKLINGDLVRSMGNKPHVLGRVTVTQSGMTVLWGDRIKEEALTGAMALRVLRIEELPLVPGAGLMPINGKLVEMV